MDSLVPIETFLSKIFLIRGKKVMLSTHLSELYDVEHRTLMQAVNRNIERFPEDFMFQLRNEEFNNLKSQIVISSWGGLRKPPHAFTEQGVAMLSSVLRSKTAIEVNIAIMRAFVQLREFLSSNEKLSQKIAEMESKYDRQLAMVFDILRKLRDKPKKISGGVEVKNVGFKPD